jgi:phosphoribosylformylglycinamidine cyclo-ligase
MYDPTKPYKHQILKIIQETWDTPYVTVRPGTYPLIEFELNYPEVDHTDGIGTKGVYHWNKRTFGNASLDALAMNLNDMAIMRATPYKLSNHIMIPQDDKEAIIEIVESRARECLARKIAMTGGETSIHDNMQGMDISITMTGFVTDHKPNHFSEGDVLIGLGSSGLHSNGFTKVREVFKGEYRPAFNEPTRIYIDDIFRIDAMYGISGMMHITGGAFTKLKDLLPGLDAKINRNHNLKPQQIFYELRERGVSDEEMYKTFNCGIGFVLGAKEKDAMKIISEIAEADVIGEVVKGAGKVIIQSMFSDKIIEY